VRRRPSAFGAALIAANNLFDSVGDELGLPVDRDEWDYDDYEDEREALGRRLVEISGRMARVRSQARRRRRPPRRGPRQLQTTAPVRVQPGGRPQISRSRLSQGVVVETGPGSHAVVVPLESGVYLVAEADSRILQSTEPERVSRALQQSAREDLSGSIGRASYHWTRKL